MSRFVGGGQQGQSGLVMSGVTGMGCGKAKGWELRAGLRSLRGRKRDGREGKGDGGGETGGKVKEMGGGEELRGIGLREGKRERGSGG
jgi:hypothetical protein